jgi:hypothetical protein
MPTFKLSVIERQVSEAIVETEVAAETLEQAVSIIKSRYRAGGLELAGGPDDPSFGNVDHFKLIEHEGPDGKTQEFPIN